MRSKAGVAIAAGTVVCFVASFIGAVVLHVGAPESAADPAQVLPPLAKDLGLDAEHARLIESHDPQFTADMAKLRAALEEARVQLAATFDSGAATEADIRSRSEAVLEAHLRVERRVVDYVIAVRDHLTPAQQKKLFSLCAEKVRESGKRWRYGRGGPQGDSGAPNPAGQGEGGFGRGRGRGHGGKGGGG